MAAKEGIKRKASGGGGKDFKGNKFSKKSKPAAVDSTKSSSAQKREVRKDRQSHRRHADVVSDAKVLWNKLRLKTNTPDENKALMDRVMELIRGKVNEIALQHDASRVVQAAIQFGNEEQRKEIMTELCDSSLPELAKIQYAHFCCLKLIKYCARDEASVKLIVKVRTKMDERNCTNMDCTLWSTRSLSSFSQVLCHLYLTVFICYSLYTVEFQRNHSQTSHPCRCRSSRRVSLSRIPAQGDCQFETRVLWSSF
jgi:hypothetical protein